MADFVCPECGGVIKNNKCASRKRCPRCAYVEAKRRAAEGKRRENERIKAENAIRKRKAPELSETERQMREADAQRDRLSAELRKKCRGCRWRLMNGDKKWIIGCDYFGKTGKLRDKSGGPGTCGSYAPLVHESRAERARRCGKKLEAIEADNIAISGVEHKRRTAKDAGKA